MANYQSLKTAINAVIKANGNKEITGTVLNEVLLAMVNSLGASYQFAGVATPDTNPGTPDQKVFYIASQAGTYTNFNSIVLPDGVSILKWNGSWSSETVLVDDGVFDISAYKATGGTLATFADLSAALNGGNNIPSALRKGGMSVKFVQSSDNKYVQYRLMSPTWSTNVVNWQGADDEPTAGSNNLAKSGGIFKGLVDFRFNDANNKIDTDLFQDKVIFNSETGAVDVNTYSMITGKQRVTPGTTVLFDNIYNGFFDDLFKWAEDGSFVGVEQRRASIPYTVPENVYYIGRYGGYDNLSRVPYEKFVCGSFLVVNDNLCDFQRNEIEDCAAALGLTPRLVANMIFYAETTSGDFNCDNTLSKYLYYRSGHINSVDWGSGRYVWFDANNIPAYLNQNSDLHWNKDINYDNLKDFDFERVLVSFKPDSPNQIEKIAIFKDSIVFTDEEWDLLHEKFNLPVFRTGKFNENGEWKSNRSFYKKPFVNLVSSPIFEEDSDWDMGESWSISDNMAHCNDTLPTKSSLVQIIPSLEIGKRYRLCYKIRDYVSGSIQARVDLDVFEGQFFSGNEYVQEEFVYTHTYEGHARELSFRPGTSGFVGNIDIVELVEI